MRAIADFFRFLAALFRRSPSPELAPAAKSGLITPVLLRAIGASAPDDWAPHLAAACARFRINTKQRVAMFLANIMHETGGLRVLEENLNYSTAALFGKFDRRRISMEDVTRLGRKPGQMGLSPGQQAALANVLYGGEWGRKNLGNTAEGDGWRYRGRGLIQITGRANYKACGAALGIDAGAAPELLLEPKHAAMSAAWFWDIRANCNTFADQGNVDEVRRRINGGVNGLPEVRAKYAAILAAMG